MRLQHAERLRGGLKSGAGKDPTAHDLSAHPHHETQTPLADSPTDPNGVLQTFPSVHGCKFATREQARQAVMDWMAFYNHRRLHSSLGYLSPMQYEQRWYEAQRKKAA